MDATEAADWMAGIEAAKLKPAVDHRARVALSYERLKRLAPLLSIIMQAATMTGVLYGLVAWRGVPPAAMLLILAALVAAGVLAAWAWYEVLGMKDAEESARIAMNPRDTVLLTPKERHLIRLALAAVEGDSKPLRAVAAAGVLPGGNDDR